MVNSNSFLSQKIFALRISHGERRKQMAANLGITASELERYEQGAVAPPVSFIDKLARTYNVSYHYWAELRSVAEQNELQEVYEHGQSIDATA